MEAPSWYKPKSASAVQEPQNAGIKPVEDSSNAVPAWYKEKAQAEAPDWYTAKKQRPSYEGLALDTLSAGTKYLLSKSASDKSIPKGIFDDVALGIGKVQGWCGEYASRLSTASKVGDTWKEKIANANKTPDAKNNIQAGYKVVLPLGVKNGQGYGHVIAALTAPDKNGNFYAAQSNADGRQNRGEGPGVATYGIFNVNDLNKRYGSNWGALPGKLKLNAYANGKGAIPVQKPQNDDGSEENWVTNLLKGGAKVVGSAFSNGTAADQRASLSNDQAPPSVLNVDNPRVLADYVLKKGVTDLQNKAWWVNSPVKGEAWKILNETRGIDTSKFNPGIVKAELSSDNPNWLLDPFKQAVGMKTAKKSVYKLTQADVEKMGKPDILTGALYKGAGSEKGFQEGIQEKRMTRLYFEADQQVAQETRETIENFSKDLAQKWEKNQNPVSAYIGKHAIETTSGFLDTLIGAVAQGEEGLMNWKEQGRLSGQSIAQIGGAGLQAVFLPYVTEFNLNMLANPIWHEIGDPIMKFVGSQAPAVGQLLGISYEKITGQKGSAKEIAPVASEIFANVAPLIVMHAYGKTLSTVGANTKKVGVEFQKNVAQGLDLFKADPIRFLKKIIPEFKEKNKGESAILRDEMAKSFDLSSPEMSKVSKNGKTKLDEIAEQRARLSELQNQGKKTVVEVSARGEKALEVTTFTYSDGKVGAGVTLRTEEHSLITSISGKFNSPRDAVQAVLPKIEKLTNKGSDIATEAIRQKIDQLKETNFKDIPAKEIPKAMQEGEVKLGKISKTQKPLLDEAKNAKNAEEFVANYHKKMEGFDPFGDITKISQGQKDLHSAFMDYTQTPEIQAKYTQNVNYTDKQALVDFYKKAKETLPESAIEKNFKKSKIVEGTGTEKTRSLAVGVEQKAIEHRLTNEFGDLPTYKEVNMGDQARQAQDLYTKNSELALKVALGEAPAPKGVLPESVFVAVENAAIKAGDVETLRQLATQSKLVSEATLMGQRIRALGERDPESPVAAITAVVRARENVILKKLKKGETVEAVKKKVVGEIKIQVKKVAASKQTWAEFIESIKC